MQIFKLSLDKNMKEEKLLLILFSLCQLPTAVLHTLN